MNGDDALLDTIRAGTVHLFLLTVEFLYGFPIQQLLLVKHVYSILAVVQYIMNVIDVSFQVAQLLSDALANLVLTFFLFLRDVQVFFTGNTAVRAGSFLDGKDFKKLVE